MAINTETSRVAFILTVGNTEQLTVTFDFDAASEILVTLLRNGIETELTITTDYTVSGSVVTMGANSLVGDVITITRLIPFTQDSVFVYNSALGSTKVENTVDRLSQQIQRLHTQVQRCLRLTNSDADQSSLSLADRANNALSFNSAGAIVLSPAVVAQNGGNAAGLVLSDHNNGYVTFPTPNSMIKSGGVDGTYDAGAHSNTRWPTCYMTFMNPDLADIAAGISINPSADAGLASIKYGFRSYGTGDLFSTIDGVSSFPTTIATGVTADSILAMTYDAAGDVKWLVDGVVVKTVAHGTGMLVFFDSSIEDIGTSITNISFGPDGSATLSDTTVTAASYGSATEVGAFTVDAKGRLTAASDVTVTPAFSSVTSKPTTLSGYGITDAVNTSALGASSGVATLDSGSKLTSSQLPDIAVTAYLGDSANEAAMLALTGQQGDWTTRIDLGTVWIITGSDPTVIGGWTQLSYPTAPVTSVATKTGAVTLDSSDVGLANVTNNAQLKIASNLADLGNATTARTNLGLGNSATLNVGTTAGTVAAGDDSRFLGGDVVGPASSTDNAVVRYNGTTGKLVQDSGVTISDSGNVGIGTTSPAVAGAGKNSLDVNGPVLARGGVGANQTSAGALDTSGNDLRIRSWGATAGTGTMSFRTGGGGGSVDAEAMRITSAGKVGIGTASPTEKLTVSGAVVASGALSANGTSISAVDHFSNAMRYFSFGASGVVGSHQWYVGAGAAAPTSPMSLTSTGLNSTAIGATTPSTGAFTTLSATGVLSVSDAINYTGAGAMYLRSRLNGGTVFVGTESTGGTLYYPIAISGTNDTLTFSNQTGEAMRIVSSGNVGIGTAAPGSLLTLSADAAHEIQLNRTGANPGVCKIENSGNLLILSNDVTGIDLKTGSTPATRIRIGSGGDVIMGGTALPQGTTQAVAWDNTNKYFRVSTNVSTTATQMVFYNSNGAVGTITTSGSATAYNTSSDYRLKENVVPMSDALQRIGNLKPSRFNFIADDSVVVDGFIAHEVQEHVPEAISGEKDEMRDEEYEVTPAVLDDDGNEITPAVMDTRSVPDYQGIDQSKLVPLLVGAIQELTARIAALENN